MPGVSHLLEVNELELHNNDWMKDSNVFWVSEVNLLSFKTNLNILVLFGRVCNLQ